MQMRGKWGVLAFSILGMAFGVASKIVDESGPKFLAATSSELPVWIFITAVLSLGAAPLMAFLRSLGFFLMMCIGYYAWSSGYLGYDVPPVARKWFLLALLVAPAVSSIGAALRRREWAPWALWVGILSGLMLAMGEPRRALLLITGQLPEWYDQTPIVVAAITLILTLILAATITRWRGRLLAAVVALAIFASSDLLASVPFISNLMSG